MQNRNMTYKVILICAAINIRNSAFKYNRTRADIYKLFHLRRVYKMHI